MSWGNQNSISSLLPGLDDLMGSIEISWSCSTLASFSGLSSALEGYWYTWYDVLLNSGIPVSITCCTVCPGVHWSCVCVGGWVGRGVWDVCMGVECTVEQSTKDGIYIQVKVVAPKESHWYASTVMVSGLSSSSCTHDLTSTYIHTRRHMTIHLVMR